MVITYTVSPLYVSLFTKEGEIAARSVHYIKIFTAMIIPLAVQYPLVDETTALGQVRLALFCSAFRKVIYLGSLLPVSYTHLKEAGAEGCLRKRGYRAAVCLSPGRSPEYVAASQIHRAERERAADF